MKFDPIQFVPRQRIGGEETSMQALANVLPGTTITYPEYWFDLQSVSWRLSEWLRKAGNAYYGSAWNAIPPVWGEWTLRREAKGLWRNRLCHFLFTEYSPLKRFGPMYSTHNRYIGTFHAVASKQKDVYSKRFNFNLYDQFCVVSSNQLPFFQQQGIPNDKLHHIPLHIDRDRFRPAESITIHDGPIQGLLVGSTERDHEFMAQLIQHVSPDSIQFRILVNPQQHHYYSELEQVTLLPRLSIEELVKEYQQAELLVLPLRDSSANNALVESMACGTPIMTNDVGGVSEYVDAEHNFLLPEKNIERWAGLLTELSADKSSLYALRNKVRESSRRFSIDAIAQRYTDLYETL